MVGESQNPVYLSTSIGTDSGRALRHKSDSGAYVDCQIAINPVTVTSGWDLQSVLTHEIGHCLGMPDKRDDDDGELTMYFQLWKNSTHQRTLEARDIAEANMLYTGVVAPGCAIGHGNPALGIIFAALAAVLLTRRTHASFRKSR
jgi:hypothetical protein